MVPLGHRKLRIAAHISATLVGGAERRSIDLLARLATRGHHVQVYCNSAAVRDFAMRAGLDADIRPLRGDLVLHDAFLLAARLVRFHPDVLVVVTFRRLWLASLAARIARVPRVVARIGLSTDVARSFKYRFVLTRWVDDVVLNAQSLLAPFRASLPSSARTRLTVIPNGVPPHAMLPSRAQAREHLGVPGAAFVIGTVARLVSQKRIDRLLHAVAHVPDVHAVIAGDGKRRAELHRLAAELGILHRTVFAGQSDNPGHVLAALDVFVTASDREGMSSAMLEALAAGIPVISTPVSGTAEVLLGDPVCGIVVEPTAEAIAAAVQSLRGSPALRDALAAAAATVAHERYSSDAMTDGWEELLLRKPAVREV
jgi:glycosyltransferase involved in cell wall biosynthesis